MKRPIPGRVFNKRFLYILEDRLPSIRMSPFSSAHLDECLNILKDTGRTNEDTYRQWLTTGNFEHFAFYDSGRTALSVVLSEVIKDPETEVWIITTSGNNYISSCVTDTINNHCKWNRERSDKTAAVLVIHEFGFVSDIHEEILSSGLPIIEDCAYAMGIQTGSDGKRAGDKSDYSFFSVPKALPIPFGGILCSKYEMNTGLELDEISWKQLAICVNHYIKNLHEYHDKRRKNFECYSKLFSEYGIEARFMPGACDVPHSFIFRCDDRDGNIHKLKEYLNRIGIESSVYYNSGGYFLPNHQEMDEGIIEYIVENTVGFLDQAWK